MKWDAHPTGHIGDAGKGRTEVAFHVNGEGLEGGNVDDAAARFLSVGRCLKHQPVEAPEEGGKGFAGPGGG